MVNHAVRGPRKVVTAEDANACNNCKSRRSQYGGGLCQRCYLSPEVRARFPPKDRSTLSYAPSEIGQQDGRRSFGGRPDQPTDAPPGSKEKMDVMEERAALGVSLFHPGDNSCRSRMSEAVLAEREEEPDDD